MTLDKAIESGKEKLMIKWKMERGSTTNPVDGTIEKHIIYTANENGWGFEIINYGPRMYTLNAGCVIGAHLLLGNVSGRVDYTLHFTRLKAAKTAAGELAK